MPPFPNAPKRTVLLGFLGKSAEAILTGVLSDRDPEVRRASVELLGTIGGKHTASALMDGLHDDDREVRFTSIRTILKKPADDGPDLMSILKKENR